VVRSSHIRRCVRAELVESSLGEGEALGDSRIDERLCEPERLILKYASICVCEAPVRAVGEDIGLAEGTRGCWTLRGLFAYELGFVSLNLLRTKGEGKGTAGYGAIA